MSVSVEEIKDLREKTGGGIMECKQALQEAGGDMDKAIQVLRRQGLARAEQKQERETAEGTICSYVHHGEELGVILELACETDFVARNEVFRKLAGEVAMQVAALAPQYIAPEDVPQQVREEQMATFRQEAIEQGKPEKVLDKIAEGRLRKFYEQVCLTEQPSIRDDKIPLSQIIAEAAAKLGENIRVKQFARFRVGEKSQVAHAP